jgi:hypothetical protein
MIKTIISVVLVISYFYIAVWFFENINKVLGMVIGIGVVGIMIDLFIYLRKFKDKKNND